MKNVINNAYSTARRPFNKITATNNSNFTKKINTVKGIRVNTARPKVVLSTVKGTRVNTVRPKAVLSVVKENAVKASACTRHETDPILQIMNKLMEDLLPLEVIPKKEKLLGKKNSVLFTDTACVVLSPDFKLTDENQVLLKVPRKDNMYSVDLKNVIPQGGLICPFAKATPDESNLWHRRFGHVNFKTINKLVKGNLGKDYILLPLWSADLLFSQISKDFPDDGFKPSGREEKKDVEDPGNEDSE
ncbi:ribonuclease H-like domain-containing protein, partial [Tanacetum coccineum]